MFLLAPYRTHSVAFNYYSWMMAQNARREMRDPRDIIERTNLRKIENPLNISESEFKKRYRLSKQAFKFLCQELHSKTNLEPSKRISLEHKVLCALSFYATGSYQRLVGMAKHLGQTSVSKYVTEVTEALNNAITSTFVKFPTSRAERDLIKQKFFRKYRIPGVCGCIDGSHFHIFTPKKDVEHLFYCREHFHSINVQIVCDSECRILNVNAKYGGATHDAFIWENSQVNQYMQDLHNLHNEHVWLLGDSGYPQRPWLMTPIPDAAEGSPEANYTLLHGKARVVIENTFGRLKNRWRCLNKDRTLHYSPEKCGKIIIACCVLHNIAIKFGVPDPETPEGDIITNSEVQDNPIESSDGAVNQADLIKCRAIRSSLVDRVNALQ